MVRRLSGSEDDPSKISIVKSAASGSQQKLNRRLSVPGPPLFRIVAGLLIVFLLIAFTIPFFSSFQEASLSSSNFVVFRTESDSEEVYPCIDDRARVQESKRILESVRRDLLQAARQLEKTHVEFEEVTRQLSDRKNELAALEIEIETLKLLQKELQDKKNVPVSLPLAPPHRNVALDARIPRGNHFEAAFDFSRCSIAGGFSLYLYEIHKNASEVALRYFSQLRTLREVGSDPSAACLFVAVVEDGVDFSSLEFFREGTNHVLLNVGNVPVANPGNALVISSQFSATNFRSDFDVALYMDVPEYDYSEWERLPSLLPYSRKYLLSYEGMLSKDLRVQMNRLVASAQAVNDIIYLDTSCSSRLHFLCGNVSQRSVLLGNSMFALIFESPSEDSSEQFQQRLLEVLQNGALPVIASLKAVLPFAVVLDWSQAILRIAPQRLPELHFILRSISASDILEMRRRGRFMLQNYFSNTKVITNALVAYLRQKIGVPGPTTEAAVTKPLFNGSFVPPKTQFVTNPQFEEEYLGPREAPHKSPSYSHNFTSLQKYSYFIWNDMGIGLGGSPEFLPVDSAFPSEFEFDEGVSFGFRPIAPGSGVEFSAALGGNRPREQFTVVLLTYRRDAILSAALERLNNMPYLNKSRNLFSVLVIWNDDQLPAERVWPNLHVPVHFIKPDKNSLNNRFVPYSEIETEAVLSLDDDIDLKQHEIIFAFRVWREQRTKIVGFPARYHARYGDEMFYNSNHTCQLSMILTGAAFLHKWYMYAYTYHMPQVIRDQVDKWMNCEDLAMNFLVSHLTREPPIKTTSKWTIRCPLCAEMLSQDESHFAERHDCIRFFTRVYGYNPLLFSQYRADSILFKTRLPPNHQKCFKFV